MMENSESALQRANALFVDENFQEALEQYNLSIKLNPDNFSALLKRSICFYKLEKFTESLIDANIVLKHEPGNAKAYLRKGMACFSLEEYETAKAAFEKGYQIEPNNASFKTWIRKCNTEIEAESTRNDSQISQTSQTNNCNEMKSNVSLSSDSVVTATSSQLLSPNSIISSPRETNIVPVPKTRHEWYQTTSHVMVTVFEKNVKSEDVSIDIKEKSLYVSVRIPASDKEFLLDLALYDKVIPSESSFSILSTKIEIKLKKSTSGLQWKALEDQGSISPQSQNILGNSKEYASTTMTTTKNDLNQRAQRKKNWDKIVKEATEDDKPEGEEALNKVFQDIYANGTDEQKRAMMKSFLESGGTVLSTNWEDVGKAPVKGSPPEGLEMHHWDEVYKK